jgi:hypothetical protein
MTLEEQLTEKQEIKTILLQCLKDGGSNGMTTYTTNGTKVIYESPTKTYKLMQEINGEIALLNSLISNNNRLKTLSTGACI